MSDDNVQQMPGTYDHTPIVRAKHLATFLPPLGEQSDELRNVDRTLDSLESVLDALIALPVIEEHHLTYRVPEPDVTDLSARRMAVTPRAAGSVTSFQRSALGVREDVTTLRRVVEVARAETRDARKEIETEIRALAGDQADAILRA